MTKVTRQFDTELAVIGSGVAGFAASVFALERGLKVAQVGNTGAIAYTTGYLDLLGQLGQADSSLHESAEKKTTTTTSVINPWEGLATLRRTAPNHPLSRISDAEIAEGFAQFTGFLNQNGISYCQSASETNTTALSPVGTLKKTFYLPSTMAAGPRALADQQPCVIIDFKGLKGFSGRQVVANLTEKWPGLSTARVSFPGMEHGEIYPEVMARALEVPANRELLAPLLKEAAGEAQCIGLPALLGMHDPDHVHRELERLTGLTIFEIPTMPPSVPGIRLREMFEQVFPKKGLTLIPQQKVKKLTIDENGAQLSLSDAYGPISITAKTVILATGRFLSGGLEAKRDTISEPLLQLPVTQPAARGDWYQRRYTDPAGHEINKTGIEVDDQFRPLKADGTVYSPRLFAAGIILAHQDWIRGRCGAGVAIASSYRAVASAAALLRS